MGWTRMEHACTRKCGADKLEGRIESGNSIYMTGKICPSTALLEDRMCISNVVGWETALCSVLRWVVSSASDLI